MEEYKDFNAVKKVIESNYNNVSKNVLLGNGFTRACAKEINCDEMVDPKHMIEKVHNLDIAHLESVEDYIYEIEKKVIKQIYTSFPEDKINKELIHCNNITAYLKYFDNYFTLNYDHILYRLLLCVNDGWQNKSTDGFKNGTWNDKNQQNTYYLHGAFHYIKNMNGEIRKVESDKQNEIKFYKMIQKEWDKGNKSHVILSSNSKRKELEIKDSQYLTKCFTEFKEMSGILVTVGVSLHKRDQHIVDAIIDNINNNENFEHAFIGWHTPTDLDRYKRIFKDTPKISYYCTEGIFEEN